MRNYTEHTPIAIFDGAGSTGNETPKGLPSSSEAPGRPILLLKAGLWCPGDVAQARHCTSTLEYAQTSCGVTLPA